MPPAVIIPHVSTPPTAQAAREATGKVVEKSFGDYRNYRNDSLKITNLQERIESGISEGIAKGLYSTYLRSVGEEVCVGEDILRLLKSEYKNRGFAFHYTLDTYKTGLWSKKHPIERIYLYW